MGFLSWIIFGFIAGLLAKAVMPGKDPGGWVVTILIGIAGAFVGGFIGRSLGILNETTSFWSFADWIFAILGGFIVLWVWKRFFAK
ncbi:MAG: GlsB/YeaQ/YmgE family stress response membrane protein [Mesonia hippocampi]|uniref:Putative membrane protein YeaQ/YmgE (Transglycosylase-associated protein family) n=1 Tax=Mesonia hippocampi TaxID=1628250 RepID=A0A840ELR0_9FLAO|nr:GlsB/YeaQ/YmgE family stress response membrane protein [Mesonia hippocampi]MBB4118031.1 putative membrane protein YeaQ/YmgE (transglycosylase-associated protein family) [Mesonia hippocampi]